MSNRERMIQHIHTIRQKNNLHRQNVPAGQSILVDESGQYDPTGQFNNDVSFSGQYIPAKILPNPNTSTAIRDISSHEKAPNDFDPIDVQVYPAGHRSVLFHGCQEPGVM